MKNCPWAEGLPAAITICDKDGIILDMNEKSALTFQKEGGRKLIGTNVLDCHPEPSRTTLLTMLTERSTNAYTIEKAGIKKMIYQVPWYENQEFAGFVEFSFEIPFKMPHFIRQP